LVGVGDEADPDTIMRQIQEIERATKAREEGRDPHVDAIAQA